MNKNYSIARSIKGRAKVFAAVIAVLTAIILISGSIICHADGYLRRNFLRTSYNPESYSLFEINGNILTARGKYADDRIRRIYFHGVEEGSGSYKMQVNSDGSYEAELSLPQGYRYTTICLQLSSGAVQGYRIDCSNVWYFSDNGLAEANQKVFDNITTASPESVGYYLSPTADAYEISVALEQIQLISDSVTEGIESDYEKARALSLYVAGHFYYDHDAKNNGVSEENVALSEILKSSRTVCAGFADLYCALLQAQGIDAVNIKGGSIGGDVTYEKLTDGVQNHEFTAFYYEDEQRWVWVDSCWNGSGDYENGEYIDKKPHEKFFDISHEALALDHRADYAQRRDFFGAKAADPAETTTAAETAVTTVSETTKPTIGTSADAATDEAPALPPEEDNTTLIVIAAVMGIMVVILGGYVAVKLIKGNRP